VARLNKEIEKLEKDVARLEGKLANPNFVDKAPEAVVNKEKEKLVQAQSALKKLKQQLASLQS
jgi:valyl-tRNA synthetase